MQKLRFFYELTSFRLSVLNFLKICTLICYLKLTKRIALVQFQSWLLHDKNGNTLKPDFSHFCDLQ